MSLATRIESLVIRVAQEFNDVRATAGSLASLSTNDKSSLVAAINELKAAYARYQHDPAFLAEFHYEL